MKFALVAILVASGSAPAAEQGGPQLSRAEKCATATCKGKNCGCDLLKKGWREIASCNGHQWTYVLEKDGQRRICDGINGFTGPLEMPCKRFTGDLEEFKQCKTAPGQPGRAGPGKLKIYNKMILDLLA